MGCAEGFHVELPWTALVKSWLGPDLVVSADLPLCHVCLFPGSIPVFLPFLQAEVTDFVQTRDPFSAFLSQQLEDWGPPHWSPFTVSQVYKPPSWFWLWSDMQKKNYLSARMHKGRGSRVVLNPPLVSSLTRKGSSQWNTGFHRAAGLYMQLCMTISTHLWKYWCWVVKNKLTGKVWKPA